MLHHVKIMRCSVIMLFKSGKYQLIEPIEATNTPRASQMSHSYIYVITEIRNQGTLPSESSQENVMQLTWNVVH